MVGLRVRFGAPFTGLNSPAVHVLLTVPRRCPSVFLRCMFLLFHVVLVTFLLVFLSTVSIFVFASIYSFLNCTPPPSPGLLSPSSVPSGFMGLLFNHLFKFLIISYKLFPIIQSFFFFCFSYKLSIILVINLSVLCLVPCSVFVWGPPWLFATGSCY
jgi:hypothetical protein